jgi:hypothetical protein
LRTEVKGREADIYVLRMRFGIGIVGVDEETDDFKAEMAERIRYKRDRRIPPRKNPDDPFTPAFMPILMEFPKSIYVLESTETL